MVDLSKMGRVGFSKGWHGYFKVLLTGETEKNSEEQRCLPDEKPINPVKQLNMHFPTIGYLYIHCPTVGHLYIHCPTLVHLYIYCPTLGHLYINCPTLGDLNIRCPTL